MLPPGRVSRTATLSEGLVWWMVPDQVPFNCLGMGRFVLASGPSAAVSGPGAGAPVPGCRPVMKNTAAAIAAMQARHAAAHRTARERPPRGCFVAGYRGDRCRGAGGHPAATGAGRQQPAGQVVAAQQFGQQGAGMRARHGVGAQALGQHRAQVVGERRQVLRGGGQVPGGGEAHHLRPGQDVGGRGRGAVRRGDAEVHHPGAVRGDHHHVRAELTVHEPGLVDRGDPGGAADRQGPELRHGQRALTVDHFRQRRPGHELGDQVGLAALDAGVEDAGHTERGDVAGGPGFRDEPVPGRRVVRAAPSQGRRPSPPRRPPAGRGRRPAAPCSPRQSRLRGR